MSPSVICGVTRSVTPMSWRSTFTEVASEGSTLVVAVVPADCTRLVMIGMLLPTRISASSLSDVRMCGAEMMLMLLSVAAARITPWISEPLLVGLPVESVPEGASQEVGEERRRPRRPRGRRPPAPSAAVRRDCAIEMSVAPFTSRTRPLKPSDSLSVSPTSMISASTSTCGRAMSSLSITLSSA